MPKLLVMGGTKLGNLTGPRRGGLLQTMNYSLKMYPDLVDQNSCMGSGWHTGQLL